MGLDDRSYAREGFRSDRGGWGGGSGNGADSVMGWPVWKKIIAVNAIVFLLQIFITRPAKIDDFALPMDVIQSRLSEGEVLSAQNAQQMAEALLVNAPPVSIVQNWCELDTRKVIRGQVWRIVTAGFCHDRYGIWHLLFNMLFLYWFGERLESRYGAREFCCFYFLSLVASSLTYVALDLYTGQTVPAIGASGAVWGVVALYAMLFPYDRIHVYFLFPVQIRFLAIAYFIFDLHPVLLALGGEDTGSGIGHAAHVGGALFGFVYWYFGFRISPLLDRVTRRNRRSTANRWANSGSRSAPARARNQREEVYKFPSPEDAGPRVAAGDEAKLDSLLAKISREGKEALTAQELEFLVDASRRMRRD